MRACVWGRTDSDWKRGGVERRKIGGVSELDECTVQRKGDITSPTHSSLTRSISKTGGKARRIEEEEGGMGEEIREGRGKKRG